MSKLREITFTSWSEGYGNEIHVVEGSVAIHINETGEKPHICIFIIEEFAGERFGIDDFPANGPIIAQQVLDQIAPPETSLADASWSFIKYPHWTDFSFSSEHSQVTGMSFCKTYMGFYDGDSHIERYELALTHPDGIKQALLLDDSYTDENVTERIVIPIPNHPLKYLVMKPRYESSHMEDDYEVILAGPKKLIDFWKTQSLGEPHAGEFSGLEKRFLRHWYAGNADELALINTSLETSIQNVFPQKGYPNVPADISFSNGRLSFSNGRHRTANLANLGAPFIPVEIYKNDGAEIFRQLFEWKGGDTHSPNYEEDLKL